MGRGCQHRAGAGAGKDRGSHPLTGDQPNALLSGYEPVQGIVQRPFRNHHGQHGQYRVPRRPGSFHPKGYFGKLAGQGHHLHADRRPKPWTV
ncbi:hypothetical protein BGU48_00865 [Clostridioides difficile]|nr:hypothetical protein BGU19_07305 [Clostridioides difficile]PBF43133.1 hypothetical protein BGU48_00865 [Clostridioides difficile]PBH24161.1 hypothetical protein BGV20_03825 [Clostridioides difficile]